MRRYMQVDVFTAAPCLGNPLVVVLDSEGLDAATMQRFTDWTNLSECTFLSAPSPEAAAAGADYRVRIFCPGRELPFAGHPTLGSCAAWLASGGAPKDDAVIVQECGAGLVKIRRSADMFAFEAPPLLKAGPLDEAEVVLIARGLGVNRDEILAHAWCDNGPSWRGVMLKDAAQVLALRPDGAVLGALDVGVIGPRAKVGVVGASSADEVDFEVRAFFPGVSGLAEDPVTGSLNAALAQWLIGAGLAPERYVVAQGTALGRQGRVYIERGADGAIWVGGQVVRCMVGQLTL